MSLRGTPAEAGGPKPFGLEFLDPARNPEFIEGLTAESQSHNASEIKRLPRRLRPARHREHELAQARRAGSSQ